MSFVPQLQQPLFLIGVNVLEDASLEVVVRYAEGSKEPTSPIGGDGWDVMSYPAYALPSKTFSIRFNSVVSFNLGDESHFKPDETAVGEGVQFARFRESRYLRFIESACYGGDVDPGMRFHYGIYCLDNIIDVVTVEAPTISFLGETAQWSF